MIMNIKNIKLDQISCKLTLPKKNKKFKLKINK